MCIRKQFVFLFAALIITGCGYGKQAQLEQYVASERPNLPKIMFADVKVVEMEVGSSEIIYHCAAPRATASNISESKNRLLKKARDYVKDHQAELKRLTNANVKLTFAARGSDGELYRFTVDPTDFLD